MAEDKKNNLNMIYCTQDCSTCPSSCDLGLEEEGPSFFERLEQFSERVDDMGGSDNFIDMLNQVVAELEKEDAKEAADAGEAPHKEEIEEAAREVAKQEAAEEAAEQEAEKELGADVEEVMEEEGKDTTDKDS